MKLKFTKKLILDKIEISNDEKTISFVSYLKEEYAEKILQIRLKNNQLQTIFFSSNEYGNATWQINEGFIESHRWETEDDLSNISYISRRYPFPIQNGSVSVQYVFEKIVPDVLPFMIDSEFSAKIENIIKATHERVNIDWDEVISLNKKLSDQFIEKLLEEQKNIFTGQNIPESRMDKNATDSKIRDIGTALTAKVEIVFNRLKSLKVYFNAIKNSMQPENRDIENEINYKDGNISEYLEKAKKLSRKIKIK